MSELLTKSSPRNRRRSCAPTLVDAHIGLRLRTRRSMLGLTQEKLAELLGITFQQVQKYENGQNRISASRLYDLSTILQIPVQFFFDDMDSQTAQGSPRYLHAAAVPQIEDLPEPPFSDPLSLQCNLELVKNFGNIKDPQIAETLLNLIKRIASN